MNNLSSYCGLVDAKIRASDKDLPVTDSRMRASDTDLPVPYKNTKEIYLINFFKPPIDSFKGPFVGDIINK